MAGERSRAPTSWVTSTPSGDDGDLMLTLHDHEEMKGLGGGISLLPPTDYACMRCWRDRKVLYLICDLRRMREVRSS